MKHQFYTPVGRAFTLSIKQFKDYCAIDMIVDPAWLTTESLPQVVLFLYEKFPEVLATECFNENNIPFYEEVKNTEIAHLFEHIVLAHMAKQQVMLGVTEYCYDGETSWNWKEEPKGHFHITIQSKRKEKAILDKAIEFGSALLFELIQTTNDPAVAGSSVVLSQ